MQKGIFIYLHPMKFTNRKTKTFEIISVIRCPVATTNSAVFQTKIPASPKSLGEIALFERDQPEQRHTRLYQNLYCNLHVNKLSFKSRDTSRRDVFSLRTHS